MDADSPGRAELTCRTQRLRRLLAEGIVSHLRRSKDPEIGAREHTSEGERERLVFGVSVVGPVITAIIRCPDALQK